VTEHIIALPYWCEQEVDNFLQLLDRWADFCDATAPYRFLLVKRFDTEPSARLFAACERHAPTTELDCTTYRWKGWPGGANGMFKNAMEHVAENYSARPGFLFWFEHDVIPIQPDWLDWLSRGWEERFSIMGHFVTQEWINEHHVQKHYKPYFSGSACYNKQLVHSPAFQTITEQGCFDVHLTFECEKAQNSTHKLWHLFDLYFFMPPWARRCDINKLMLNGAKEFSQREKIIQYILENR
jgi:hypothetical protein